MLAVFANIAWSLDWRFVRSVRQGDSQNLGVSLCRRGVWAEGFVGIEPLEHRGRCVDFLLEVLVRYPLLFIIR